MQVFNRLFASLIAIAWGVLLGWLLFIVWRPGEGAKIESDSIHFNLAFNFTTSEQVLATVVIGVLMLPAAFLLGLELFGFRGRSPAQREFAGRRGAARYETLESRIARLESQSSPAATATLSGESAAAEEAERTEEAEASDRPAGNRRPGFFRRFRRHNGPQTA